jgi:hypothetical protein
VTDERKKLWETCIVQSAMKIGDSKSVEDIQWAIRLLEISISSMRKELKI